MGGSGGHARRKLAPRMQKRRELRTAIALPKGQWRVHRSLEVGGGWHYYLWAATPDMDTIYPGPPGQIRTLEAQQPG